jgi:carbonic anhydrase/acetyltransferase-like protein (isoleucine patch superfamily)
MTISAKKAVSAYMTVAGAPQEFVRENAFHKEKDSSYKYGDERRRYPYEIKLDGADVIQSGGYTSTGKKGSKHPNGGGFVASTAKVDSSVYVGPDAMVLGNAVLKGNVRVEDKAVVNGDVTASDNVVISGHAVVDGGGWIYINNQWQMGKVTLSDNVQVGDGAVVSGGVTLKDNAKVFQKAFVTDGVTLSENAVAKGMTYAYGAGDYSGQIILDGDYANEEKLSYGVGFGWLDESSPSFTNGMISAYDFNKQCSVWANDRFAATDALLKGGAKWEKERTFAKGVISLDGNGSYVEIDPSSFRSHNFQLSVAVLWKGGSGDIFFAGDEKANMRLITEGENGNAEFIITDGNTEQKLVMTSPLQKNVWNKITVRLIDGRGEILLNGKKETSGEITLTPVNVLSVSDNDVAYLGKGPDEKYFKGAFDYCEFYFQKAAEPVITYTGSEEPETALRGDIDLNGKFNSSDVLLLQKWLLGTETDLADPKAGDLMEDGKLNIADLCAMKHELLMK